MDAKVRPRGRWKVWLLFLALLAGLAVGIWAVMPKSTYRVTGVYKERWGETMILVQHDPVPALDMKAMELMSFFVESKELIDSAKLTPGDRVRIVIRQIPDKLLVVKIEKIQ